MNAYGEQERKEKMENGESYRDDCIDKGCCRLSRNYGRVGRVGERGTA